MVTNNNIFVNNETSNTVSVISAASVTNLTNVATAPGTAPFYIQMSPDGKTVVTVDITSEFATFIDTGTNVATTVAVTTPGLSVRSLSITADNKYVVFGNNQAAVIVVDLATKAIVATLTIPGPGAPSQYMVTSSDSKTAYDLRTSDITVVDLVSLSITTSIVDAAQHLSGIMNKGDTKLYVVQNALGNILVIDTATNAISTVITTAVNPQYACIDSTGTTLYYTDQNGLTEVDTATDTVTFSTAGLGTTDFFPAIRNDNGIVAFGSFNAGTGNVYFYDTATHAVVSTFNEFARVASCTASEDGNFFYAVFTDNQQLAIFDSHAFTLTANPSVQANARFATSGFTGFKQSFPGSQFIPKLFVPQKGKLSQDYTAEDLMDNWIAIELWAQGWKPPAPVTLFFPTKRTLSVDQINANWITLEVWANMVRDLGAPYSPILVPRKGSLQPSDLDIDFLAIQNWANRLPF